MASRGRSTGFALVVALAFAPTSAVAAETAAPPATAAAAAPAAVTATTAAPRPPTLYDIVGELAQADRLQRETAATLRDTADWKSLGAALDAGALTPQFQMLEQDRDPMNRVRYLELRALDVHLRERLQAVGDAAVGLGRLAQRVVSDLDRLDRAIAVWPQRAALAREHGAPEEIQRRVDAAGPALAELRSRLVERRDQLLIAYERALRMQARLESTRSSVAERRERLWSSLRTAVAAPIWKAGAVGFPLDELRADGALGRYELFDYLRRHGERIVALALVVAVLLYVLLRRPVAAAADAPGLPGLSRGAALGGALAGAIGCTVLFAPAPAPFVFYRLVWFAFPLLAAVVATRSFARPIPATAWTLAFGVFLNEFRALAEMSPAIDWGLLALQVAPFGVALVHDLRRGTLQRFLHLRPLLLRRVVAIDIAALVVAVAAGMFGYVGLALALVAFAVIAPGFALAFGALGWTLDRALASLLASPLAQPLRGVRERRGAIHRVLRWVVGLAATALGATTFALSYSALDDVIHAGALVSSASVTVGDVTITLKAVLLALAVAVITWIVTRVVRFVLDYEVLPRLRLRTGVPVAISTIVGYVLVVTGFVLAMAALGVDLTKVTLLAGAVGVGVGFGLQNVVNNFASGLILMLERPVNVGDQVDVGGVVGEVRRIGVRSSTIRTSQGAEVIVPNSDLAGKQVTNWTLSDRARRYEIDVGVAYGSDPAQVLRLLEAAAAGVPEVQKKPPPRALFTGFGESSLDFRLYAWVETLDVGLQAQNNLRMAVLKALEEARIEIPFPQQELRIRHDTPVAGSAAPRAVA